MVAAAGTQIDHGIPIPGVKYRSDRSSRAIRSRCPIPASQTCAHSLARRASVQISTRKEGDLLRVWRVS